MNERTKKDVRNVAFHVAALTVGGLAGGFPGLALTAGILGASRVLAGVIAPKAAHAASDGRLDFKVFYAWAVDKVNEGAGQDTTLQVGGFKADPDGIAPGSYPEGTVRITSASQAISKCLSWVLQYQQNGTDARGRTYWRVFGQGRAVPIRALGNNEDGGNLGTEFCRIDYPEREVFIKVNLANRAQSDVVIPDDLPQDLDNPVGG